MGKEQDLLQAVKSADLHTTHKLLSKLKSNRNSKYTPTSTGGSAPSASAPSKASLLVGGATSAGFTAELGEAPTVTCGGSNEPHGSGAQRPRTRRRSRGRLRAFAPPI